MTNPAFGAAVREGQLPTANQTNPVLCVTGQTFHAVFASEAFEKYLEIGIDIALISGHLERMDRELRL